MLLVMRVWIRGYCKFQARNSLMFSPDADVSPYHPLPPTAESSKSVKKVDYVRTRLKEQEHDVGDKPLSAPPSPTRSRVDAAIAGTSMCSRCFGCLIPQNLCSSQVILRARVNSHLSLVFHHLRPLN